MENIVTTIPARTIPPKTVSASPEAMAAITLALKCVGEIELAREQLSQLAGQRADAIRSALEAGMSQADVARLLGISGQAVNNILRQH